MKPTVCRTTDGLAAVLSSSRRRLPYLASFWTFSFLNLCASMGFFMAVLRKSKNKEEPVLEDLPKEYYDDTKRWDKGEREMEGFSTRVKGMSKGDALLIMFSLGQSPSGTFVHPSGVEHYLSDSINALRNCYGDKQLFTPF
ncbi:hypothetical protein DVH24_042091 [Malus domestica]|uniref:Uncharacterized protein n=1 Tax=Malus domestica TaxID=3750 RepID=A0A498IVB8_MALDO|nr:hypothetical protein DVH24_042091 [Malus domestica]